METPPLGFVLLFVNNPQKSSQFYQELFEINPMEESPTFTMFALKNGVMLGLLSKHTAEPRVESPPGALEICFPTVDVDALYESWGKKLVTIAQKPTDMDFRRTFVILDLNLWRKRSLSFFYCSWRSCRGRALPFCNERNLYPLAPQRGLHTLYRGSNFAFIRKLKFYQRQKEMGISLSTRMF